jgi:hypothetical protein
MKGPVRAKKDSHARHDRLKPPGPDPYAESSRPWGFGAAARCSRGPDARSDGGQPRSRFRFAASARAARRNDGRGLGPSRPARPHVQAPEALDAGAGRGHRRVHRCLVEPTAAAPCTARGRAATGSAQPRRSHRQADRGRAASRSARGRQRRALDRHGIQRDAHRFATRRCAQSRACRVGRVRHRGQRPSHRRHPPRTCDPLRHRHAATDRQAGHVQRASRTRCGGVRRSLDLQPDAFEDRPLGSHDRGFQADPRSRGPGGRRRRRRRGLGLVAERHRGARRSRDQRGENDRHRGGSGSDGLRPRAAVGRAPRSARGHPDRSDRSQGGRPRRERRIRRARADGPRRLRLGRQRRGRSGPADRPARWPGREALQGRCRAAGRRDARRPPARLERKREHDHADPRAPEARCAGGIRPRLLGCEPRQRASARALVGWANR